MMKSPMCGMLTGVAVGILVGAGAAIACGCSCDRHMMGTVKHKARRALRSMSGMLCDWTGCKL